VSRPDWARRDPRAAIAIAATAFVGAIAVGGLLLAIFLGAGGEL